MKGTVIHERLVAEHGFTVSYQRVKVFRTDARPRIAAELHPRFEVVPGAQAQVDWGDEGDLLVHVGISNVYSFHMTLSHPRDPLCCFTTSMDMATFWGCHRCAFAHFGGVSGSIVYGRTKTVIRRHVAPRVAVPLHPEAVAFAEHYRFTIDVLAAYRPTGKGRVERQVLINRDHVIAGSSFDSVADMDAAWATWLPIRRAQVHRTHGQVIAVRAEADRAALLPLPAQPYLVAERHLRRVGKDTMISFESSVYSLPAKLVRAGQRVQVAVHRDTAAGDTLVVHAVAEDGGAWLATHPRAALKHTWVVDEDHWNGLPDGHTRAVTTGEPEQVTPADRLATAVDPEPLSSLLHRRGADVAVAIRPLSTYQQLTGTARHHRPRGVAS